MALKPVLKLKVDELFLRWLSETETQTLLKANLRQILRGEPLQQPNYASVRLSKPQSPRIRPASPSTPPCSPTINSPRSPRRNGKSFNRQFNRAAKERDGQKSIKEAPTPAPRPSINSSVTSSESFLRQKEAQLKEKREREKDDKTHVVVKAQKAESPSSPSNHVAAPVKESKVVKRTKDPAPKPPVNNAVPAQNVPEFYFPAGKPNAQVNENVYLQRIREEFAKGEGGKVERKQMDALCKACGFPQCMKGTLFTFVGGEKNGHVTLQAFLAAWRKMRLTCFDEASQFVRILARPNCVYLEEEDMKPLVQDVVDTHPGLSFLHDAKEFHSRYVQTVISRIFYCVNRSWSGRITASELRKSNLLQTLHLLDEEEDINQVMDFFSYEHFYVIYCKFWELDKDHDLSISCEDLNRHADHAMSTKIIERIFSGAVTKLLPEGKMSYRDFVWFLISEEDKRHPTSIEYWFRCMDLDGDGVLSLYEMEYFYEEQVQKMESLGIETLPFEDCVCQMLDMVRPRHNGHITLMDLKSCQMTPVFFDTFFNLDKYLEHEQRDPFANIRDIDGDEPEMSDWEKFAAEEYEILVAEEGASEAHNEEIMYEDDFEPEEEDDLGMKLSDPPQKKIGSRSKTDDDIYDFTKQDLGY